MIGIGNSSKLWTFRFYLIEVNSPMSLVISLTTPTKVILGADKRLSTIEIPLGITEHTERHKKVLDFRDDITKITPIGKHIAVLSVGKVIFGNVSVLSLIDEYANKQEVPNVESVANKLHTLLQEGIGQSGEEIIENSIPNASHQIITGYDKQGDPFPQRFMFYVPGIVSEVEVNSECASLNASGCTEFMFRAIAGLDDTLKRDLEECTPRNKQSKLKRIIDNLDRYKYHFRNG